MSTEFSYRRAGTRCPAKTLLPLLLLSVLLAACSSGPTQPQIADIPPLQPHEEPPARTGNPRTYEVFGNTYTVSGTSEGYREQGIASWYGEKFHGRRTSSGPPFDMYAVSAAHKSLPIPTYVRVTNLRNQRSLVVKVTDRGPFVGNRIIDLSYAAAAKLGMVEDGLAPVEVEALKPYQYLPGFPYDNPLGMIADATIPAQRDQAPPLPQSVTGLRFAQQEQPRPITENVQLATYRYAEPPPAQPVTLTATSHPPRAPTPAEPSLPPYATRSPLATRQQLYLQVGAFGLRSNAEELRHRLMDYLPYDITVMGDTNLHRVKIGPLGRDANLDTLSRNLSELGLEAIHVVLE